MKRIVVFFLFSLFYFSALAQEIKIISTTGMIADIVKNLMPEGISSHQMMASGIDPHTYKPLARDLRRIQRADVILYNGFHLEANLHKIFSQMSKATAICEKIKSDVLLKDKYGVVDPHLWMDIALWQSCVKEAALVLQSYFPEIATKINSNFLSYQNSLRLLEQWAKKEIARVPKQKRILVTAHDAFGYFGKAYGFEVRAIQGISTASEAGVRDIRELADFVVSNKVPVIFLENSVAEHNIIALRQAVLARGWQVKIGEKLYSDSMGVKGSGDDNYQAMMRHNISSILGEIADK
jgi:manganese/zinc/iron transport system substrate-binding protein